MPRIPAPTILFFGLACFACGGSDRAETTIETATLVAVDPSDFLGSLRCGSEPGQLRRYVATLIDVPQVGQGSLAWGEQFSLPSSKAVPCDRTVGFERVVDGHRYVAQIEGYDRGSLTPLSPGSSVMVDSSSGEIVEPAWTTRCGDPEGAGLDGPTSAVEDTTVTVHGCIELVSDTVAGPASVELVTAELLGALQCGAEEGEVESISVLTPALELLAEAACGETLWLDYEPASRTVHYRVEATLVGGDSAATHCRAVLTPGETDIAACDPLTRSGALEIPWSALLGSAASCDSLTAIEIHLDAQPLESTARVDCSSPLSLPSLPAGEHSLTVTATAEDGSAFESTPCPAQVIAAETSEVDCAPLATP